MMQLLEFEAIENQPLKLGDFHPHTLESWYNLIEFYEAWGRPEKAKGWRAKLPQTVAVEELHNTYKITSFRS